MKNAIHSGACVRGLAFAVALLALAGCAVEVAPDDQGADSVSEALQTVVDVDFENYPLGALGSPWTVTKNPGSTSTATIVNTSDHGRALLLHGSPAAAYLIAELPFSSSEPGIDLSVAIKPTSGASFIFALNGAGPSLGARRIRLQRTPGSTMLAAQTSGAGTVNCGNLTNNAWNSVQLVVRTNPTPKYFDVLINGVVTGCNHLNLEMGAPFTGVTVMDA